MDYLPAILLLVAICAISVIIALGVRLEQWLDSKNTEEMMSEHIVSVTCEGERCGHEVVGGYCGEPATHKVGEELPFEMKRSKGALSLNEFIKIRHNLTMYVCCEHFGQILGTVARQMCGTSEHPLAPTEPN